ncbi:MAG: PfkB family carbohydrate kinase [Chitinispirillales bacterium]|jgi:2-dehydro-3-deoxygluconokinase|nr:PfkB family carbohydrate kinase [Chitinispirillales bacterium]
MKTAYNRNFNLLVIGECLVEFECDGNIIESETFRKDIGGADIVVAAAAARLGSKVQLVSAIARDPFHSFIHERLISQGIDTGSVVSCQGYNGVYFTGSRYPEQREYLAHHPGTANRFIAPSLISDELIDNCKIVYASSELQSVSRETRRTVFKAFHLAHSRNIMVAYDPNLRLMRWSLDEEHECQCSDTKRRLHKTRQGLDEARECLWNVLSLVDVVFLSSPEESMALFGLERPFEVIGYLWDRNSNIIAVVKTGANGCVVGYDGKIESFLQPTPHAGERFTPTLVGSAFNGSFLHAIACGYSPFEAAALANSVALYKGIKGGGIDSLPTEADINT